MYDCAILEGVGFRKGWVHGVYGLKLARALSVMEAIFGIYLFRLGGRDKCVA
jgi:hypothetical protein